MASTPSTLGNIELQAAGENLNTWGQPKLNDALTRLTEMVAATTAISSYPITLTATNYVANQARNMILNCTGAGGTITIPAQSKVYIVRNACSAALTITTGSGTTATVAVNNVIPVICDGTNVRAGLPVDMQGNVLKSLGTPVAATDAATKAYSDANLVAANAYTDATAFASGSLPGQGGNAGKYLSTDGSVASWQTVLPSFTSTTDYFLTSTGSAAAWTAPASARTKLGLGGAALLNVGTTAATVAAGDDSRIVGAAQTTGAVFVGAISGPAATFTTFTGALVGNASTASTWATSRTLSFTGDVTGSGSVNGSANVATALTLANTAVSAGSYGSATAIPTFTVDAKGRLTAAATSAALAALTGNSTAWEANVGPILLKGGIATAADSSVTFANAFPNQCLGVQITARGLNSGTDTTNLSVRHVTLNGAPSASGFSYWSSAEDQVTDVFVQQATNFYWMAYGT